MIKRPTRRCPVAGCGKPIKREHLMCAPHWFKVPRDVQREVLAAFRRWEDSDGSHVATENLQAAQRVAIAEVESLENIAPSSDRERT